MARARMLIAREAANACLIEKRRSLSDRNMKVQELQHPL
jgi:hypothetical protein